MSNTARLVAVVDDEPDVRRALQRLLCSAGFEVETYASGADFIASIADHAPACLVLDLHMPELSGFDVQARLNERHAGFPVVVITGHDTTAARTRTLDAGASAYFCKPVDGDAILGAIENAIAAHEH